MTDKLYYSSNLVKMKKEEISEISKLSKQFAYFFGFVICIQMSRKTCQIAKIMFLFCAIQVDRCIDICWVEFLSVYRYLRIYVLNFHTGKVLADIFFFYNKSLGYIFVVFVPAYFFFVPSKKIIFFPLFYCLNNRCLCMCIYACFVFI